MNVHEEEKRWRGKAIDPKVSGLDRWWLFVHKFHALLNKAQSLFGRSAKLRPAKHDARLNWGRRRGSHFWPARCAQPQTGYHSATSVRQPLRGLAACRRANDDRSSDQEFSAHASERSRSRASTEPRMKAAQLDEGGSARPEGRSPRPGRRRRTPSAPVAPRTTVEEGVIAQENEGRVCRPSSEYGRPGSQKASA